MARFDEPFALKPKTDWGGRVVAFIGWSFVLLLAAYVSSAFLGDLRQFSRYEPRRRTSLCLNNLRDLSAAFSQYVSDNDIQFPSGDLSISSSSDRDRGLGWTRQIASDTKPDQNYQCPDDTTQPHLPGQRVVSYGYNSNIASHPAEFGLTSVKKTVLLFEVSDDSCVVVPNSPGSKGHSLQSSASGDGTSIDLDDGLDSPHVRYATGAMGKRPSHLGPWPKPRHLSEEVANYLFADGHAHWSPPHSISTGTDAVHAKDTQTGTVTGHAAGTEDRFYRATFSTK